VALSAVDLAARPPSEWPEHIKLAWTILHDELRLPEARAFQLILDSVSAAQDCAEAINGRSRHIVGANSRAKVRLAFKCVANCCRRASAGLRRQLDAAILPLLAQDPIDSEVIEAIIEATAAEFGLFYEEAAAATGSRAIEPNNWLKNEYVCLRAETRRNCEAALSELGKKRKALKAHMVFDALAACLENEPTSNHLPDPATLISNYVSALTLLWQAAELHPGRGYRHSDPSFKSEFHRYSELILTAVGEPWTQRHSGDLDHMRRRTHKARAGMPREYQASAALPPSTAEWLVSEHILRKGLRFQKQRR
jgi:hypothetical protein